MQIYSGNIKVLADVGLRVLSGNYYGDLLGLSFFPTTPHCVLPQAVAVGNFA